MKTQNFIGQSTKLYDFFFLDKKTSTKKYDIERKIKSKKNYK